MSIKDRLQNLIGDASPSPDSRISRTTSASGATAVSLDSTFATRSAQLTAARESLAARLAEQRAVADRMMRDADRAHADESHALAAAEHATYSALRAALVRDAHDKFEPLVTHWREAPSRAVAMQIFETLVTLVRREVKELGTNAGHPHVLLALGHVFADHAAKTSPGVLVALAHGSSTERAVSAHGLIMRDAVLPSLEGAAVWGGGVEKLVAELEASIESIAASNRARPMESTTAQRWELVRAQDPETLERFDAGIARQRAEQAAANYHAPVNTAERSGHNVERDGAVASFG